MTAKAYHTDTTTRVPDRPPAAHGAATLSPGSCASPVIHYARRAKPPLASTVYDMLWITFEGLDGCGKSTQSTLLADALGAVLTREPGGTALGVTLRQELLGDRNEPVSATTEMLLYAADRAHHLHNVVLPALEAGTAVVSDRSVWSSVAYQGFGRELGADVVIAANEIALAGRWPDVVVFIDTDAARRSGRMQRSLDRMERSGDAFFERTETGFRILAAQQGWVVVDGDGDVDDVYRQVIKGITARIGERFVGLLGPDSESHGNR